MIKALIVEPNREFRGFLRQVLAERFPDGAVDEASNALDGLRLMEAGKHDIVVVDLALPGRPNGFGFIARMREQGRRAPILVMSNDVPPEDQLEAARLGADWFLPKAASSTQEIIAAVERLTMLGGERLP